MLDCRDYDMALVERIKSFYDNTHWIVRPTLPITEIRNHKLLNGEDVSFPLITVRRTKCPILNQEYNSWSRTNSGKSFNTAPTKTNWQSNLYDYDKELADKIVNSGYRDGIYVVNSTFTLEYYIDVISLERDNFDTLIIELQENLLRVPYISLYNMKSDGTQDKLINEQSCHINFESVDDTSDFDNFDSGNALYRATITVNINAYIYRKYKAKAFDKAEITLQDSGSSNYIITKYEL